MDAVKGALVVLVLLASTAWAAPPSRVRGVACQSFATSTICALTGVASGDIIIAAGTSLGVATAPTISDNCGGVYHAIDTDVSSSGFADSYSTGSSGSCTVTFNDSSGLASTVTGVAEEITAGTLDVHHKTFSSTTGTVYSDSVTANAADYVFTYAVDESGSGGSGLSVASPFTIRDTNGIFPEGDGDDTQASAGSITATWTFPTSNANRLVATVGFKASTATCPHTLATLGVGC